MKSRFLELADFVEICQLIKAFPEEQTALNSHITEAWLRSELESSRGIALITSKSKEISAFVLFREVGLTFEITFLATHVNHRNRGLMREIFSILREDLLKKSLEYRAENGAKGSKDAVPCQETPQIWLEVSERNEAALRLYRGLGMKETGVRPKYYRDGSSALLFSWDISSA